MNPLKSISGTIVSGFILAILIAVVSGIKGFSVMQVEVWLHAIFGVAWVGLLYYFNFVQVPAVAQALGEASDGGPGPAAINKYVAPKALFWFRWASIGTWLTGLGMLQNLAPNGALKAFMFSDGMELIGIGAWLGTIMLFNVWAIIWPKQKVILGLDGKEHSADEVARAKVVALMASRTNTVLSVPMLLSMTGFAHGLHF
ncbi:MAG: urate hydroxylase PuuD [Pseudomonadota bacterium]